MFVMLGSAYVFNSVAGFCFASRSVKSLCIIRGTQRENFSKILEISFPAF